MKYPKGKQVTYEYRSNHTGRRYVCTVVGERDGWVLDVNHGTHLSTSFRPEDVIVFAVGKADE